MIKSIGLGAIAGVLLFFMTHGLQETRLLHAQTTAVGAVDQLPEYVWDPTWPKLPLQDNWVTGPVVGVATDGTDHIWVVHRERTAVSATQRDCCSPAPAVLEFDQAGSLVQAWGGPSAEQLAAATKGPAPEMTWTAPTNYPWVNSEHNFYVDHKDNVWLGKYSGSHVLKFTRQGKFLLQIGRAGAKGQSSNDTDALASPTGIAVDPKANEVFIADGYGNRRVIVFDADTGAYKRHWGAYGNRPDDSAAKTPVFEGPGDPQFNVVHHVRISTDGLVYVADRLNRRIQIFTIEGKFLKEAFVRRSSKETAGTVSSLAFSADSRQQYLYVADQTEDQILILDRQSLTELGSIGRLGRYAGQFVSPHNIATDSQGNLYVAEDLGGQRFQKFVFKGLGPATK